MHKRSKSFQKKRIPKSADLLIEYKNIWAHQNDFTNNFTECFLCVSIDLLHLLGLPRATREIEEFKKRFIFSSYHKRYSDQDK